MADNRFIPPKSTLEVLETVPESVLRRLKQYSGRLSTEAVRAMEERLPFFADLEASQRASVQLRLLRSTVVVAVARQSVVGLACRSGGDELTVDAS